MADWHLWVSIACILVGLALILLEVVNPGFFIAVPGTVLVGFGFAALIAPRLFYGPAAGWVIPLFGIPATVLTLWAYKRWAPPGDKPVTLSNDSLPGRMGRVEKDIPAGGTGKVRIAGQVFHATADRALATGTRITVTSVDGFTLIVETA